MYFFLPHFPVPTKLNACIASKVADRRMQIAPAMKRDLTDVLFCSTVDAVREMDPPLDWVSEYADTGSLLDIPRVMNLNLLSFPPAQSLCSCLGPA